MEKRRPSLEEVFSPRGIAVVGVSPGAGGFATGVTMALKEARHPAVYPVNPKYTEVFGLKCYPSVRAIPGVVDHVVVSIPAEAALALLDDCAAKGVKSVHFFTAGFSESGVAERAELERAMLMKARAGGFRIIGPNCIGLFVPGSRLVNSTGVPLEPGPVAFISQSGGHGQNIPFYGGLRGLRFSKVVSYGNALDVDECELLDFLADDSQTKIISAYIEGVRDGKRFRAALAKAASRKPVIIYKGGTTEAGKRAAHGHTASLTSSIAAFNALCRQMGAILVDDADELIDMLVAFSFAQPLPRGTGVAVLGAGGGPSVLASDELEKAGLHLPHLSTAVQTELKQVLPVAGSIFGNPVDTPNLGTPEAISAALKVVSRVSDIHMMLYHLGFHPITRWGGGRFSTSAFLQPAIQAMKQAQEASGKPVLLALKQPPDMEGMKDFMAAKEGFVAAGFPVFHSLREGAKALSRVVAWEREKRSGHA